MDCVDLRTSTTSNLDVLIVEDEPVSRRALTTLMTGMGYGAHSAGSAEDALLLISRSGMPRVALVDLDLPGMSGYELIRRVQAVNPAVIVVLITAASTDVVAAIQRRNHINYLPKPVDFDELLSILSAADPRNQN